MWFDSWAELGRVVVVGAAAYATLVAALRVSGKRTLAKLNAFDFVVTVALGSTLAAVVLDGAVTWAAGATAFAVLLGLQLAVSWTTSRLWSGRTVVTSAPTTVLRDGVVDAEALRRQRLTTTELRQAVRSAGVGGFDQVARVVVETDGTLSVIPAGRLGDGRALEPGG